MRNVVPAGALARRSRNLLTAAVVVLVFSGLLLVIGALLYQFPLVVRDNAQFPLYHTFRNALLVVSGVLFALCVVMLVRALTWQRDNPLAKQVGDKFDATLNDRYVYIRNVSKISLGYLDGVLIGPPGILVCRVIDRTGVLFNEGGRWMRQQDQGQWQAIRWNPTKETAEDVRRLREWLKVRGMPEIPVYGVIVSTQEMPAARITTQSPVVPVIYLSELDYQLSTTYFAKDRLDQPTVNKIATLLFD